MRKVLTALVVCGMASAALAQAPSKKPKPPFTEWFEGRVESTLVALSDSGDVSAGYRDLDMLLRTGAAHAPEAELACLTHAAAWFRLLHLFAGTRTADHKPSIAYLREHPALALELGLLYIPASDKYAAAGVLRGLIDRAGPTVARFPALAAAMCVVYDEPRYARSTIGKPGKPVPIDPGDVFEYFVKNERALLFAPESLPPQLLVYLVDTTAEVSELEWALRQHGGDGNVGRRYNDLVYDTGSFKYDRPKKIEAMSYTLQNLKKVGGVCAEQAYYAAHVAKAIGVPGATIFGQNAQMSHAWVGFLQRRGQTYAWNMDEGHYDQYQSLRGRVDDPQFKRDLSDDELALTARIAGTAPAVRRDTTALLVASRSLRARATPAPDGLGLAEPRSSPITLIDLAQRRIPEMPTTWHEVRRVSGMLTPAQRQEWFERATEVAKKQHPYFAYDVVSGMIEAIEVYDEQIAAWDWAFKEYRSRPDLAGNAKLRQGKAMAKAGDLSGAYAAYMEVVKLFVNEGTFVLDALAEGEAVLKKMDKEDAVAEMYGDAFRRTRLPPSVSPGVFRQSNYYRIGSLYAAALTKAGRGGEAHRIRMIIDKGKPRPPK